MAQSKKLSGQRLLLVEDEYLIAADLIASLESLGVEVIGPAATVEDALSLVENNSERLDCAVLDINLRNERVYPVADVLVARGVPFIFTTGYDAVGIPNTYACVPRCEKPVDKERLIELISHAGPRVDGG
jgi:CheY-like chemotaxis protein